MRHKLWVSICASFLFLLGASAFAAWGQNITGGVVAGTVADNTGAAVVVATVNLIDKATSTTRSATANADGHYIFQNVPPGTYDLTFGREGFEQNHAS